MAQFLKLGGKNRIRILNVLTGKIARCSVTRYHYLSISLFFNIFYSHKIIMLSIKSFCRLKLFYDSGKMVYCTMSGDDQNDLPYVVNRLKLVTPGCEVS